jgi:hypothetical protein
VTDVLLKRLTEYHAMYYVILVHMPLYSEYTEKTNKNRESLPCSLEVFDSDIGQVTGYFLGSSWISSVSADNACQNPHSLQFIIH